MLISGTPRRRMVRKANATQRNTLKFKFNVNAESASRPRDPHTHAHALIHSVAHTYMYVKLVQSHSRARMQTTRSNNNSNSHSSSSNNKTCTICFMRFVRHFVVVGNKWAATATRRRQRCCSLLSLSRSAAVSWLELVCRDVTAHAFLRILREFCFCKTTLCFGGASVLKRV